jgi:LPXTG-motif cell wall-anchored protein
LSAVVAGTINAALLPVKGTVSTAVNATLPLLQAGGSGINQLADASVLGSTSVTLPTTVSAPQGLTQDLDANFVGSVIRSNTVDVNLISTGNGISPIYFAASNPAATVTAPTVNSVTGTSTTGYTVTGTADPNVNVEIRNQAGTVVGTATANDTGAFTVNIATGSAAANENLNAVAINGDTESTATGFQTPADPAATVTAPTVNSVTGTSTTGYTVTGTADPNVNVEIRNQAGTVVGTATANDTGAFTVNIATGSAAANENLNAVAINGDTESTATGFQTPAEAATVQTPVVDKVTGSTTKGYEVTGTAEAGTTIEVRSTDGTVIGTGTTAPNGDYTVTLAPGKATAAENLNVVAINAARTESQPATATTPADVAVPAVDKVTGSTTKGYEVIGTAEANQTVEVRDTEGNVIGTGTANAAGDYTVTVDAGKAGAGETINVVAKDNNGNESQPATATTPADVTAPTVDEITGNTTDGYEVGGKADPNTTIEVRDPDGTVIGTDTSDTNGDYAVVIDAGKTSPGDTLTVVGKDADGNESQPTTTTTPADPVTTAPTINNVTGTSTTGYTVTGTADKNAKIEIRNQAGTVVGTATANDTGAFTVNIATGSAAANENLNAVAITGARESTATGFQTPADPTATVQTPVVDKVTGSTTKGYEVTGTAEANQTVEVRDTEGNVIGTGTANATGDYTVTVDAGKAGAGETINVVAKDSNGNESQPATATTPADVTVPTVDEITGNPTDGYEVGGKADPNTTIEVRDPDGTVIGTDTSDTNGDYTVVIDAGKVEPGDTITVIGKDADGNESQPKEAVVPVETVEVAAPTVNSVTGTSTTGYTVTGTADPNVNVEIRNQAGTVVGTATANDTGAFTVNIATGSAAANENLNAVAINGDTESTATGFQTPADPAATVQTPVVDKVTGSTTKGYEVTGTAEAGTTIEVRSTDGTVIGTGTTAPNGDYTVTLAPGKATAAENLNVVAINAARTESQPATATTPADVTAPTVDEITGNPTDGYEITGKADPNTTIEVRDPNDNIVGTGTSNGNGDYTVTIEAGKVNPGDTITVIGKDADGNESQPTTVTVPVENGDITIAQPIIDSVTGTSKDGYVIKGKAEPNRTIQIRNTRSSSMIEPANSVEARSLFAFIDPFAATNEIATTTTNGAGDFTVELAAGQAQAEESLLAIATDGQGNYSEPTFFSTPADQTSPTDPTTPGGNGNGGNGSNNGGVNNGNGTGTTNPGNGAQNGVGTGSGSGLGSNMGNNMGTNAGMLNGFGRGNAGSKFSNGKYTSSYSTNKGTYPRTGENQHISAGIFGGLLALLAALGLMKHKRKEE